MNIFSSMNNFLLSEWLWNVTRDWYHIPVSMLLCAISFRWVLRMRSTQSIFLSITSVLFAFFAFSFFIMVLDMLNVTSNATWVPHYFYASFYLGLIFTLFQSLFFILVHQWYPLKKIHDMMRITFLCNCVASIISYYLLLDPLL